jgi:predicted SprT family Zn-dependent metalloprotease
MAPLAPDLERRVRDDIARIAGIYGMARPPAVVISGRLRRDAARTYPESNLIVLNREYVAANLGATWRQVQETIAHEMAHTLAGRAGGHGAGWARLMRSAGFDPDVTTTGNEHNSPPHYALVCRACGAALFRFGKPRRAGACPICGGAMRGVNIEGTRLQARWEAALGRAGCRPQQMEVCAVQTGCGDLGR